MLFLQRLSKKRLGEILMGEGLVAKEDLAAALIEKERSRRLLSDVVCEDRLIDDWDLASVQAQQYQIPFIDLDAYSLHDDLVSSFPAGLLHQAGVVPMDRFGDTVCFACQEIPSQEVAQELKAYAPGGQFYYIALRAQVQARLHELAACSDEERKSAAVETEEDQWQTIFDEADSLVMEELTRPADGE